MALSYPFVRIYRPYLTNDELDKYILDSRYAADRQHLCRTYSIIESDLKKLFEYVEPCDDNQNTYSLRTYELLLRASTEFETNCKKILEANGYPKGLRDMGIEDYFKIIQPTKLEQYKLYLNVWMPAELIIEPFKCWQNTTIYKPLEWYQDYNQVKHNRESLFNKASLRNTINAVAGVLVILFAQFADHALSPYQKSDCYCGDVENEYYSDNSLFRLFAPTTWTDNDKYDFRWDEIKSNSGCIKAFDFR